MCSGSSVRSMIISGSSISSDCGLIIAVFC